MDEVQNSISEKQAVKNAVLEIVKVLDEQQRQQEHIKDICNSIHGKYGFDKKLLRSLAKHYHKQSINDTVNNTNEIFDKYEELFG